MDTSSIRSQFPALDRVVAGRPAAYLDGPGGTQVPRGVIDAMAGFLEAGGSNHGGPFVTSRESDAVAATARAAIADLINAASPDEIAFGQNMTSIALAVSRALGATWGANDNVVVTRLDHDANVWPWVLAARDAGAEVRWVDFDPGAGCRLDLDGLAAAIDQNTRLVACTHASNAVGTIVDVGAVVGMARGVGALTFVDAVHFAPHGSIDVTATGCDFLVASAYKFFGPHTGFLYGRREVLDSIAAYKIRPAPDDPPGKWETGTQSFESLAGVTAAVDHLASLGEGATRRECLVDALRHISDYEQALSTRFLAGLGEMPGIRLFGLDTSAGRTPTFAIEVESRDPHSVAAELGKQGIFVWSGDYYAREVMARLGRADQGLVRIGFVHYNTVGEVDRVLAALG